MAKTYNIYCDESTHLPHDGQPYVVYSYVSIAYNQIKHANAYIKMLIHKHHYEGEMKWIHVNEATYPLYKELVEYFFMTDMNFRAVVMDKRKLPEDVSYDELYVKLYYHLLHHKMHMDNTYNIYIDIKDTRSQGKLHQLRESLRWNSTIRNCQFMRSVESSFMQIADVLMGALNYKLRVDAGEQEVRDNAKWKLVNLVSSHVDMSLPKDFTDAKPMAMAFVEMK